MIDPADVADAAMIRIDTALRQPLVARLLSRIGIRPPRCIPIENRRALRLIRRHMAFQPVDHDQLEGALHRVALSVRTACAPAVWHDLLDEDESPAVLDEGEAERARSLIMRGEVDDCLHHLERALPADYAVIAERLAFHIRSRP